MISALIGCKRLTLTLINLRTRLGQILVSWEREKYHKEGKELSETNIELFEVIREET